MPLTPIANGDSGLTARNLINTAFTQVDTNTTDIAGKASLASANTFSARQTISVNGAASAPPLSLTGTWFTGGSSTTTKPALLVEASGATSTGWSTSGTGLGVNAASGFTGHLMDLQLNGATRFTLKANGDLYTKGEIWGDNGRFYLRSNIGTDFINMLVDNLAMTISPAWKFGFASASNYGMAPDAFFMRGGSSSSIQMGEASATPASQTFKGPNGSGTNIVGGKLSLAPGQSTGNATPAVLALQGTAAGSSGTTAQTLVDVLTIVDKQTIALGVAAGGTITVQLPSDTLVIGDNLDSIGFFGATSPQMTASAGTATSTVGSSSPLYDDSMWTGGLGFTQYSVYDAIRALKLFGFLAQ